MVLVFYIILIISFILLTLLNILFIIYISKLELKIYKLDMSNIDKKNNNNNIMIQISLKIGNIKWLSIKLNKEKLSSLYGKIKKHENDKNITIQDLKMNFRRNINKVERDRELKRLCLKTKIELQKFEAEIYVGTKNYMVTSYLVAIISTIIANILPHVINDKIYKSKKICISDIVNYKITPIYKEINMYNIKLTMTTNTKVSHLINILIKFVKLNKEENKLKKQKLKETKNERNKLYKKYRNGTYYV